MIYVFTNQLTTNQPDTILQLRRDMHDDDNILSSIFTSDPGAFADARLATCGSLFDMYHVWTESSWL